MDDLVAEVLSTPSDEGEGWRVVDLVKATGLSKNTIRERLHVLDDAGRLAWSKRTIRALGGRRVSVTVYRLRESD